MPGTVVRRCRRHGLVRGLCEQCERATAARRSAKNVRDRRNTSAWKRTRRRRLTFDRHVCQYGFAGCTIVATTVDLVGGGDHATARVEDCLSACLHCHGKTDGGRR